MNPSSARGASAAAFRLSWVGGLVGALALSLSACDRSGAPPAADASAAPAAAVQGDAVVSTETTSASVAPAADAAPPLARGDDVPVFAVLYPGAAVHDAPGVTATGPAGPGGLVTFVTPDAPDAVVAFYRQRAESAGLTSTMAMSQGEARAYGAAQGAEDGASVQVVASPDGEGRTSVQLAWSRGR